MKQPNGALVEDQGRKEAGGKGGHEAHLVVPLAVCEQLSMAEKTGSEGPRGLTSSPAAAALLGAQERDRRRQSGDDEGPRDRDHDGPGRRPNQPDRQYDPGHGQSDQHKRQQGDPGDQAGALPAGRPGAQWLAAWCLFH
jgi:hypothetical protein